MFRTTRIRQFVLAAMMTAIFCILAPVSIPIGPVPITLATLILPLLLYLRGTKWAIVSCVLYLLLGFFGLPVFSGFTGGVGVLLGPTGGFLLAYPLFLAVAGCFLSRGRFQQTIGLGIGLLCCYVLGTVWYCIQTSASLESALLICVLPFLPADAGKLAAAMFLGPVLQNRLQKAGLL